MATTAQHVAARRDEDLIQRFVAAAEQAGQADAEVWVRAHIGALITAPVSGSTTIADVHAYAAGQRKIAVDALPPAPGADPAAVTDEYLAAAVAEILA